MTSRSVMPDALPKRYETHHEKLMTLFITRQDQEFVVSNDLELVDIELIRSSVELVGEPGWDANSGTGQGHVQGAYDVSGTDASEVSPTYMTTINELYALNKTGTSTVYNITSNNGVIHTTHLNHGWANIEIQGMTQGRQFMQDERYQENQLSFVVPTDHGLLSVRTAQQNGPPQPLKLENVKLQQRIKVHIDFAGTWPREKRIARFVEDFADTNTSTYRNADGTVQYYEDDSGGDAIGPCQIPANMINCVLLQFKVKPRTLV